MSTTVEILVERLRRLNAAYRRGEPLVGDERYDALVENLRDLDPDNPYLKTVEAERFAGKQLIRHPAPMLSTEKAYTAETLARFVDRVAKAAAELGLDRVQYRVTPKLDGLAGRDNGDRLVSRGNGEFGYDISGAFEKGVVAVGGRGRGLGEIVVLESYFHQHLKGMFEHPRNMVVGIVSSDTLNAAARTALDAGAVHFVPYAVLPFWKGEGRELLARTEAIISDLISRTDYPVDGAVVEATQPRLKRFMGATSHHHRWQIAVKSKGETAVTVVEDVTWQVGRTGTLTPVLEVRPVSLSGATIRRVTAHHAGMIVKKHIGIGAEIEVIRSGEVIPKLEEVLHGADSVVLPQQCPVCGSDLLRVNDFIKCPNPECRAQKEQRISHWFTTLGNADWFGIKTIKRLVENGYDTLEKIYAMQTDDFTALGFGPVQSRNLARAIQISRTAPVEDWRFLAAFGIVNLGKGDSRKLLSHMALEQVLRVDAPTILSIAGFGEITSRSIASDVARMRPTMAHMLALGFNISRTPLLDAAPAQSAIAGKKIVFSGKMQHGSREEMQAEARALGAVVQSAVSGGTDILVCGEKVGAVKLKKAEVHGVRIVSETDYRRLIAQQ